MSTRSYRKQSPTDLAREVAADAVLTLARAQIAELKALGYGGRRGPHSRRVDAMLRAVLTEPDYRPKPGPQTPLPQPKETQHDDTEE